MSGVTKSVKPIPTSGDSEKDPSQTSNSTAPIATGDSGQRSTVSGEVEEVGMQWNSLPPMLYTKMCMVDQFNWSKADSVNHLLWYTRVSPNSPGCNEWIRYFTAPFNNWGGGLRFGYQIAGTGFNAGKLFIVKLPPNFDPTKYSPQELSMFPFVIVDPKQLDQTNIEATDQRIQKAHWNLNFPDNEWGAISSDGGYLAIYVQLPLVTSSTGNDSVNVQIYNSLAPDFRVSQMRPIPKDRHIVNYPDIDSFINKKGKSRVTMAQMPFPIPEFYVDPVSSSRTTQSYDMVAFGDTKGPTVVDPFQYDYKFVDGDTAKGPIHTNVRVSVVFPKTNDFQYIGDEVGGIDFKDTGSFVFSHDGGFKAGPQAWIHKEQVIPHSFNESIGGKLYTNTLGEHMCGFGYASGGDDVGSFDLQSNILSEYILALKGSLPKEYDLLFQLYSSGIPVRWLRLRRDGYMTTNAVTARVYFDVRNIKFKFVRLITRSEHIPKSSNEMIAQAKLAKTQQDLEIVLSSAKAKLAEMS